MVVLEVEMLFTVTVVVALSLQPLPFVTMYLIVEEPVATPVTKPLELMVAMLVFELLQIPELVASLKVIVLLAQTVVVPEMAATVGFAFTVIVVDTESLHPLAFVTTYLIVVLPALTGVRTPLLLMVATLVVVELHTPPTVALLKVLVLPIQTLVAPVMAATVGKGFMVAQV